MQLLEGDRSRLSETRRAPISTSRGRWRSAAHATQRLEGRCWRLEQSHAVKRCCCKMVVVRGEAERLRAPIVTSSERWRSAAHATQRLECRCWRLEHAHAVRRCCCKRVVVRGGAERLRAPIVTSSERWRSAAHATQRLESRCWRLEQAHAVRRCCCTRVVVRGDAERLRAPIVTSSERWRSAAHATQRLESRCWRLERSHAVIGAVSRGWSFALDRNERPRRPSSSRAHAKQRLVSRRRRLEHTLLGVAVARGGRPRRGETTAPRPARRVGEEDRRRCQSAACRPELAPRSDARWQAMLLLEGARSRWSETTARPDFHVARAVKIGGVCSGLRADAGASSRRTLAGDAVARGWSSAARRNYLAPRPVRRDDDEGRRRCQSSAMTRGDRESRLSHRVDDGDRQRMPVSGFRLGLAPRASARWHALRCSRVVVRRDARRPLAPTGTSRGQ